MGRASQKFDRQLFALKLSEPARQMQMESSASDNAARSARLAGSVLVRLVDGQLAVLRSWLETVDRICREVWQTQGETITSDFVREVLVSQALTTIEVRVGVIESGIDLAIARGHRDDPYPARRHLAMEASKLKGEMANRYEIEARELEYQKAPAAQSGPQSQLDELGGIRGLMEDATRDTIRWLQADPPAEERVHVLAIQGLLANLARIVERRMERRGLPEDDRRWLETLSEVVLLLYKAGEVRGYTFGQSLARLAERLPRELPDSKPPRVSQTPAPPRTRLGGSGIGSYRPKATQAPPDFPPHYPNELMARTAVIRTKAVREFPEQPQILELCKKFVSEMTPLFYEAANTGTMRADLALGDSGMSGLLHSLLVYNCDNDDERYRLKQDVRRSDEWSAFEIALAEAEKTPKAATSTGQNIDRLRKECGWSFDKLAEVTGIDKKQILSHVNKGTKPHPRILKEYAQAFSRELRRQITVADLEK